MERIVSGTEKVSDPGSQDIRFEEEVREQESQVGSEQETRK